MGYWLEGEDQFLSFRTPQLGVFEENGGGGGGGGVPVSVPLTILGRDESVEVVRVPKRLMVFPVGAAH